MFDARRLTIAHVASLFHDCLFKQKIDDISQLVPVEGVWSSAEFNAGKLTAHHQEIADLLAELPIDFLKSHGQGAIFGNLCYSRQGIRWTTSYIFMDQLVQLGIGIGKVSFYKKRYFWNSETGEHHS